MMSLFWLFSSMSNNLCDSSMFALSFSSKFIFESVLIFLFDFESLDVDLVGFFTLSTSIFWLLSDSFSWSESESESESMMRTRFLPFVTPLTISSSELSFVGWSSFFIFFAGTSNIFFANCKIKKRKIQSDRPNQDFHFICAQLTGFGCCWCFWFWAEWTFWNFCSRWFVSFWRGRTPCEITQ